MTLCLFGFYRNADDFERNIEFNNVYIFCPSIKAENDTTEITHDKLIKYGKYPTILIYNYDKQIHIEKSNKLNIPKFNEFYQQSYRIFSFFYHIKRVLEMVPPMHEDEIILLSRIDIGLKIDYDRLQFSDDIMVNVRNENGELDDKWFLFRYKHIHVFTTLYDTYETYLTTERGRLPSTRPEDVIYYHFMKHNMKVGFTTAVTQQFKHVCSEFCGHNGVNTKT
jgi:hypothetical protein